MSFEARYIGPDLAALFDAGPARRAAERMANTGGDRLHEVVGIYTPVRTGNLRSSWYRVPTVREGSRYTSFVRTDVDYAPHVNYGTGLFGPEHRKYLIEPHPPRQFLSWIDPASGGRVFARRVWHPGSEGAHMVEHAAREVEAVIPRWFEAGDLQLFRREMEAQAMQAQAGVRIG